MSDEITDTSYFLQAKEIDGVTRVMGSEQEEYSDLPIRDETLPDGTNVMVSKWTPTAEQLQVLTEGGSIYLGIMGEVHPPIVMSVAPSS